MRFCADGPSIPEDLLEESDRGNVVFFCGAGVSKTAGLPGFLELTNEVMEELGTPRDADSYKLLKRELPDGAGAPLDQVFYFLQQEYGAAEIEAVVGEILLRRPATNVDQHAVILRLSRNAAGTPQVVTTNQ